MHKGKNFYLLATAVVLLCGCGTDDSRDTAKAKDSAKPSPAPNDGKPVPAKPDAPTSTPTGSAKTTAGSKLEIGFLLPRPIQSEKDAEECLAAVADLNRRLEEVPGETSVTKRLKDCIIQYDPNSRGYIKFYPGRVYIRFFIRSSGIADVNVFVPGSKIAVINIRIDDTSILASCRNVSGTQKVNAYLFRSSDTAPFSRNDGWEQLFDPDTLEKFCMQSYNDFQQLRDH